MFPNPKKIRPVLLQRTHALIIENQRKVKRWKRFIASGGSVLKRRGKKWKEYHLKLSGVPF
jgi:hypothetical protein